MVKRDRIVFLPMFLQERFSRFNVTLFTRLQQPLPALSVYGDVMPLGIGIPIGIAKASGGVPANLLLTNLQNYYKLDEASGNAVDSVSSNTLTAQNGPTSVAGLISTARNFDTNSASAQFFSASSSLAALKFLQTTFSISLWFKVDQNFINNQSSKGIFKKANLTTGTNRGWAIFEDIIGTGSVLFGCSPDGTSGSQVDILSSIPIDANVWHNIVVYRNFGVEIGLSVDGNGYETAAYTGNIADNAAAVNLGPSDRVQAAGNMVVDEMAIWTNFIPSSTQLTWLYNSGAGRALSEYSSAPLT